MSELTIITNNVPRDIIDAWKLSEQERSEFDYIDWPAVGRGEESASFVRYMGQLYDLNDTDSRFQRENDLFAAWDAVVSDSFFSGVLFRYTSDYEQIVCGRYYS